MDRKRVIEALRLVREHSKKRKFEQSVDFILNFKGIDFRKAENRVDLDVRLPHSSGKKAEVRALVFVKDSNFAEEIKGKVAKTIMDHEIAGIKKKDVEQILRDYNILLAEGPSILTVAKFLGQQLAPKGMMPKPIQASVQSLEQATRNISTSTKVSNKKGKFMPVIQVMVGKEGISDEHIADNVIEVYNSVLSAIPGGEASIKSLYLKATMGPPVRVGEDKVEVRVHKSGPSPKGAQAGQPTDKDGDRAMDRDSADAQKVSGGSDASDESRVSA